MLYRQKTLTWDSPMPTLPLGQRHESPKTGDNIGAIKRAAGHPLDLNITRLAKRNWALHYPTPGPNGYTLRVVPRPRHAPDLTRKEARAYQEKWGVNPVHYRVRAMTILSWRRPNGEAPLTEHRAIQACVRYGTLAIRELKSPEMGLAPDAAEESMAASRYHGHPAWFKTLFNMKNPRGKVALYQAKGAQVVLIFGKFIAGRARRLVASRRIQAKWGTVRAPATW
jgi:hypothetical protein